MYKLMQGSHYRYFKSREDIARPGTVPCSVLFDGLYFSVAEGFGALPEDEKAAAVETVSKNMLHGLTHLCLRRDGFDGFVDVSDVDPHDLKQVAAWLDRMFPVRASERGVPI